MLTVNLKGPYLCALSAIPRTGKRGGGAIVNTASVNGYWLDPSVGAYCASKGDVIALRRSIAPDFGKHGIRCRPPAQAKSKPAWRRDTSTSKLTRRRKSRSRPDAHARGSITLPREIAAVALFLCSEAVSFWTEQPFIVDVGFTVGIFGITEERSPKWPSRTIQQHEQRISS